MAVLQLGEDVLTVKATHNVLSELIRITDTKFKDVLQLAQSDPMGWIRDILYCSLLIYNPDKLKGRSRYEIGDELFALDPEVVNKFRLAIMEDFVVYLGGKSNNVASEKK